MPEITTRELINHDLVPDHAFRHIRYEERPVPGRDGQPVAGLHQVWIWLDKRVPAQLLHHRGGQGP